MAGQASPFIKSEPNDFFDLNQYMQHNNQQSNNMNGSSSNRNINVNPANLTNGMSQSYMSQSYQIGGANIADDELAELSFAQPSQQQNGNFDYNQNMQNFMHQQSIANSNAIFSHTPDGQPIQSPFVNEVNFAQFRPMGQPQNFMSGHSVPQGSNFRPHSHLDRTISDSRSPATPNTPAIHTLTVNDDFGQRPGMQPIHRRQQNSLGGWDSTPSGHSWEASSPFASPANGQAMHPQISEVLKNSAHHGKIASSLPTKIEPGTQPPFSTQEAKRRRRRESHNMVERRRRDNINERIHDLGTLVPQHRLEDEKVRKHLQTNAPLSPSIANATSMSPPTSLLSPNGRRPVSAGTGNITQGLPIEDKDKGPNKGDILNGSVAWTRDIMWYLNMKLRQEQELQELVSSLGGVWPFEQSEDERRMRHEICEILGKHAPHGGFTGYSRTDGTGLRVPGFTNLAGDNVGAERQPSATVLPPMPSPGFQSSGMNNGMSSTGQFWSPDDFKEEDEYDMDMQ